VNNKTLISGVHVDAEYDPAAPAPDGTTVNYDEIAHTFKVRYMSAQEAYMRLFSHPIVRLSHTVYKLVVHLEGQARVVIPEDADEALIQRRLAKNQQTQLTQFLKLCERDEEARQYTYEQIGRFFSWTGRFSVIYFIMIIHIIGKDWKRRTNNKIKIEKDVISRMYHVNARDKELGALRILLMVFRGPQLG